MVPSAVRELGNATGFELELEDRGDLGHDALMEARNQMLARRHRKPLLAVRPNVGRRAAAQARHRSGEGTALGLIGRRQRDALAAAWGGRISTTSSTAAASSASTSRPMRRSAWSRKICQLWSVAQATARWCRSRRSRPRTGLTARRSWSATTAWPRSRSRAKPAPGMSSGDAMGDGELAAQAAGRRRLEWTGLSYQERLSGRRRRAVRALAPGRVPVPGRALRKLVDSDRRSCWWCRSAFSARCSPATLRAERTTSIFRSACSPRSACRRRTRS